MKYRIAYITVDNPTEEDIEIVEFNTPAEVKAFSLGFNVGVEEGGGREDLAFCYDIEEATYESETADEEDAVLYRAMVKKLQKEND